MVNPEQFPKAEFDPATTGSGERVATLAGGCFWCVEAVYRQLDGVSDVVNGYAGGAANTADYRTVSTGRSGHAEAVQVHYDPARVSYGDLLRIFFSIAHDPTTKDRQGADVGAAVPLGDLRRRRGRARGRRALHQAARCGRRSSTRRSSRWSRTSTSSTALRTTTRTTPRRTRTSRTSSSSPRRKVAKLQKYFKDRLKTVPR